MLTLESVTFKNFRSYGNQPTTVHLNRRKATVITAPNGSGKSTILLAIEFGLFGRVSGGINKNDLVNTVNKKDLVVEIKCTAKGRAVRIIRGIRPAVFEIYVDEKLINQDSSSRDYQGYLEDEILGFTLGAFHQIVSVSGSSYTPFLLLSAGNRRRKVEEFLNLTVFTKMNQLHLAACNDNKEAITQTEFEISKSKAVLDTMKKALESIESKEEEFLEVIRENIDRANQNITSANDIISGYNSQISKLQESIVDLDKKVSRKTKLIDLAKDLKKKIEKANNFINFLNTKDTCPTCSQVLEIDFRVEMKEETGSKISEIEGALAQIQARLDAVDSNLDSMNSVLTQIRKLENDILVQTNIISSLQTYISEQQKIISSTKSESDPEMQRNIIKTLEKIDKLKQKRLDSLEEKQYNEIVGAAIKDSGIKSRIISQYIPKMNQEINRYLEILDLGISFEMNENFEEKILSRFKDEMSYSNFSAGERARIDIAILFTWRELAKLKNSLSCNLLFLDEIFDSVLDDAGLDAFINLLAYHLQDTNVFLISHRPEVVDKFETNLKIVKGSNFSRIE